MNKYDCNAFLRDNLDYKGRFTEQSIFKKMWNPSFQILGNGGVRIDFFRYDRCVSYGFCLIVDEDGVRLESFRGIRPKSKRDEYELKAICEIVSVTATITAELERYKVK